MAVAFDTKSPTFRSEIFTEYKANRERQPEDIQVAIPIIKNFLHHTKNRKLVTKLETKDKIYNLYKDDFTKFNYEK